MLTAALTCPRRAQLEISCQLQAGAVTRPCSCTCDVAAAAVRYLTPHAISCCRTRQSSSRGSRWGRPPQPEQGRLAYEQFKTLPLGASRPPLRSSERVLECYGGRERPRASQPRKRGWRCVPTAVHLRITEAESHYYMQKAPRYYSIASLGS